MFFVIDGTGKSEDPAYSRENFNSFCKGLERRYGAFYYRGPSMSGLETYSRLKELASLIQRLNRIDPKDPTYLAGHSRGGAAVIALAYALEQLEIDVKAMFLYDAVERTLFGPEIARGMSTAGGQRGARALRVPVSLDVVPKNVANCYHAVRNRSLAVVFDPEIKKLLAKEPGLGLVNWRLVKMTNKASTAMAYRNMRLLDLHLKYRMRTHVVSELAFGTDWYGLQSIDFGNCGTTYARNHVQEVFNCSHGAIGGAPISPETVSGRPSPSLQDAAARLSDGRAASEDELVELLWRHDCREMAKVQVWMDTRMREAGVQPRAGKQPLEV